ncbi:MAG: HEAT repeat domain-containing protein [Fimbriimonas sp.]
MPLKVAKVKVKGVGRMGRTLRSLLYMALLGAVLFILNLFMNGRDVAAAIGPEGETQRHFFLIAAERPDMLIFFKSLKPEQRLQMAQNVGRYSDPQLAKLIVKLLETFDTAARAALTQSLTALAKKQPAAVAERLEVGGSFQQLAMRSALKGAGPEALPLVAERLTNAGARPNAVAFLVEAGPPAIPPLLPMLGNKDKDVRLAAADALGKLRAKQALSKLVALYNGSTGDEQYGYLAAIAGVGDPSSETLLTSALNDEALPAPQRAQAALGLGRIGSESAIDLLWRYAASENHQIEQSSITALQVVGDLVWKPGEGSPLLRIAVAEGIKTQLADNVIALGLGNPATQVAAARSAARRPALVRTLTTHLERLQPGSEGDVADAIISALATTAEGRKSLAGLKAGPLAGLIQRRLQLMSLET